MKKLKLLLVLLSLFIGFSVYANDEQGEPTIYIIYRDTNGKMAKTLWEVPFGTGHVGFLIVYPDGSSYVVDTIPATGVRKTDLAGFNDGLAQNLWFVDAGLSSEQVNELIDWLNAREGIDPKTGEPKYPFSVIDPKGPDTYDCVGLVEAALESLIKDYGEQFNLTPDEVEKGYLFPYEQLQEALAKLKEVDITDIFGGEELPQPTDPGNDHPDDYMGVLGKPILKETEGPTANVAVLYHGFPRESSSIIGDSCWLWPDVEVEVMKQYPALIIPSGGFFGLKTSQILKYKLRKYVEDGGVLVCFAQQQGYEFSCLPGTITAYGWGEDQSCWQNAGYIDTDHPIFASQTDPTLDAGIDGYFTQWPNDATILLRRTKNQMPAMLMYKYGSGTVIASTLYTDFSSAYNRASDEEIRLINDLISYVEDINKEIPEYKPGDEINLPIKITYEEFYEFFQETPDKATQVEFTLRDSDKKTLSTNILQLATPLALGQSTQINFQTICPQDKLGIFWINYTLKDQAGNILKPETKGERFYVSRHLTGTKPIEGLSFSITSPTEYYFYNDTATFTFHLYNQGTQTRNIKCEYGLLSEERFTKVVNVPPQGTTFTTSFKVLSAHGLFATFYDENNHVIGNASRAIWLHNPKLDIKINTDKKGDKGIVTLVLQDKDNKYNLGYNPEVRFKVTDPIGDEVFATNTTLSITPNGSVSTTIGFPLITAMGGVYLIKVEVYNNESKIGVWTSSFEIPEPEISSNIIIPEIFVPNSTNTTSFLLNNISAKSISGGSITIEFRDQDLNLIFGSQSNFATLSISGSTTVNFNIPIESIKFGTYKLVYIIYYEGKSLIGKKEISCSAITKVNLDKPEYRIRETLIGTLTLINSGKFKEDLEATITIDDLNFVPTNTFSLLPEQKWTLPLNISIPETLTSGYHYGTINLHLSTSTKYKQFSFYIPPAELKIELEKKDYIIGDMVNVTISNIGGVDESCDYKIKLADSIGVKIYEANNRIDKIEPGKNQIISFLISDQAVTDNYVISMEYYGEERGTKTVFLPLKITGVISNVDISPDKTLYSFGEPISIQADIFNQDYSINNGKLNLKIYRNLKEFSKIEGISPSSIGVDDDNVWFTISERLIRYNKVTGTTTSYDIADEVPSLCVDENYVWFLDHDTGLIERFNKGSGQVEYLEEKNKVGPDWERFPAYKDIIEDNQNIWFSSTCFSYHSPGPLEDTDYLLEVALHQYNKSAKQETIIWNYSVESTEEPDIINYLPLCVDERYVYFGVEKVYPDGNKVLRYDKTNGAVTTLLTRNEEITSLAVDENHLWIGTNDKLI
ncbi:MAG: hypothetical protein AB1414_09450, partial [bacterium]